MKKLIEELVPLCPKCKRELHRDFADTGILLWCKCGWKKLFKFKDFPLKGEFHELVL